MAQKGQGRGAVMGNDRGLMEGTGGATAGAMDAFRVEL